MVGMPRFLLALIFIGVVSAATALGEASYISFPSDIDWVTRNSPNFEIIYRRGHARMAERALLNAEKVKKILDPIFPEAPEKVRT